ncbi:MAG: hypothetical protein SPD44_08620, partial [Prevotella sp.]|nr:hypothetical protein [Prevotella sp.]
PFLTVCVNNLFVSAVPFSGKRVQRYCFFLNYQNFWGYFFEKYALFAVSLMLINGNSEKRGKYRAVTRPTQWLTLIGEKLGYFAFSSVAE